MITADKFLEIVNRYNNFDVHFAGKNIIVNYLRNVSKSYLDGDYIDIAKFYGTNDMCSRDRIIVWPTCILNIDNNYGLSHKAGSGKYIETEEELVSVLDTCIAHSRKIDRFNRIKKIEEL